MARQNGPTQRRGGLPVIAPEPEPGTFAPFAVRWRTGEDAAVLAVAGEIDLAVEDRFRGALDALLAADAPTLVIDLSAVAYMDSTGVQALLAAQTRADEAGSRLLVRIGPAARRVLVLCGVLPRFTVVDGRERRDGGGR